MNYRRGIAVGSLVSGLVALYLHLFKIGVVQSLACPIGDAGCEYVQQSVYGSFVGFDVAAIGVVGYALMFAVATIGGLDRFEDAKWPTVTLMVLIYAAMLFTLRLKYYEFFVLHGFCPWCLVSAITITLCTVLVTLDFRRVTAEPASR
jgi:uncharacterized membrane protein